MGDKIKKSDNYIIARRRKKIIGRRILDFLKLVLIIIFFALSIWGLNYFYNSDYFKIKSIDIQGNKHYKDEEIKTFVQDLTGINIFEVNKKKIEDGLTKELSWIKKTELSKVFPDKIVIKITEREPYLKIVYMGNYFLIDDEGVVLDKIDRGSLDEYKDLILVKNAVSHSINVGEKIAKKNVLSCAEIYDFFDSDLKNLIKEARLDDNISGDIIFYTVNGREIIFGDSSDISKKVEILKELLKGQSNCSIIDLRISDNPVIN
ncbi:MAG: FtsQ-type POTRA domain-containing protein [Actinomycetota bacterium]|nr:FtsQ-type POTRA domain-containing protein [Actinomycetota bacterium]